MEYGGIRLRTSAYLERTRIPVVLDIGFGDALADAAHRIDYPSLLDMDQPSIRAYPPASVIAEKFQAIVALGLANGRMKDFHDQDRKSVVSGKSVAGSVNLGGGRIIKKQ